MRIILDAMGGDNAPQAMVEGAVLAAGQYKCDVVLTGDSPRIESILNGRGDGKITVVHTTEVIEMDDPASSAVRHKKDSSMAVGLRMLRDNEGDAFVSAGSTGAVLSGATLLVKRIPGIRRAALAPVLPTKKGGALLIDCGANVDCTPEYLLQFAYLGYYYMQKVRGIANPRVALINNGAEEHKGGQLQQDTYALLKEAGERINFIGNIEGRDIPSGDADVLVTDGFTGNVVLKTIEGVAMFFMGEIKDVMMENTRTKLAAATLKPGISRLKERLDYKEIGGAPMLGISKPVLKAHGSCDARALCSAIGRAVAFVESGYIQTVENNIGSMTVKAPTNDAAEHE